MWGEGKGGGGHKGLARRFTKSLSIVFAKGHTNRFTRRLPTVHIHAPMFRTKPTLSFFTLTDNRRNPFSNTNALPRAQSGFEALG